VFLTVQNSGIAGCAGELIKGNWFKKVGFTF
jgi:hypothetical protein